MDGNKDTFYLGAYWGNRKESVEECADRLLRLLTGLAGIDEVLARWYRPGRSRKEALSREVRLEAEALQKLVDRGRHYTDVGHRLMEDLGFSVFLWNGAPDDDAADIHLSCGGCASNAVTWIPNTCVLDLPRRGPASTRVNRLDMLTPVLATAIKVLEPDWAVVNSNRFLALYPRQRVGVPLVGWLTYLSPQYGGVQELPPPATTVEIDEGLRVILATSEPLSRENPEHVEAIRDIREALERAGLLRRLDVPDTQAALGGP